MKDKIKEILISILKDETKLISVYTGGGEEPTFVSFTYSEDADHDVFINNISDAIAQEISKKL